MRLYTAHYGRLVRLAGLLVRDQATAEQVVKGSFGALRGEAEDRDLAWLKRDVVQRARAVLRGDGPPS